LSDTLATIGLCCGVVVLLFLVAAAWDSSRPKCKICGRKFGSADALLTCDSCEGHFCQQNAGALALISHAGTTVSIAERQGACGSVVNEATTAGTRTRHLCADCLRAQNLWQRPAPPPILLPPFGPADLTPKWPPKSGGGYRLAV
jgi:hypothetical protein